MKVLQITTSINGGAGIAALRLHKSLQDSNVKSGFLSIDLTVNFDNEVIDNSYFTYKRKTIFKRILSKIRSVIIPSYKFKQTKKIKILKSELSCEIATLPFSNYQLHNHPLVKEADIINLHWVSGILDYPSFFKNCKKPIIWTLHDMNPFQGVFHYRDDENRNKHIIGSFDKEIKRFKGEKLNLINNGVYIAPSNWMQEYASRNLNSFSIKCISNSVDLNIFKIKDKVELRKKTSISSNEFVLLFVSDNLQNPRKGFDLLIESLFFLKKIISITVLVIGNGTLPEMENIKVLKLGNINNEHDMANWYSIADLFVLPSREDNLPNVMLEAFSCGLPIISFTNGGMKEHLKLNKNGILIKNFNGKSLGEGILDFYKNKTDYNASDIRKYAEDNFSFKKQADAYLKIYNKLYIK
ncbi:glycosyltransferase [Polaribacter sp. PL03]|uniref:glycosyltransferase n=1 Tax=Polaribacter sp. PL03 TaxID=3088353 RepID=UPI0029D014D9|nr:glycosyltransferase [Polaribacter sp. PL03]MDX6746075.1 glycosyltransferase [Polaribacter sp. PL03]